MTNEMMDGMGDMMWGIGLFWLLVLILVGLGIGALVKYLFFNQRRRHHDD